jgi:ubiquinone/menaquinone biosynthesis C-methylase UbiE
MSEIDNSSVVKQQYAAAGNLENRISFHEKYSTNKFGWFNWLFSNYNIKPGDKILELGSGNGRLWAEHFNDLPDGVSLTLSDFSESMIETAKAHIGRDDITYQTIDIQNIPYPEGRFDVVIANMMLYHVPDIDKGLSEVKRVLKDTGRFYAATFGENGIAGFVEDALHMPGMKRTKFTLQNGSEQLERYFPRVEKRLYADSLVVTDTNDLIEYIRTLTWSEKLQQLSDAELFSVFEACKQSDVIMIPKEYGTFVASKE